VVQPDEDQWFLDDAVIWDDQQAEEEEEEAHLKDLYQAALGDKTKPKKERLTPNHSFVLGPPEDEEEQV
jgi:hypothetical protein